SRAGRPCEVTAGQNAEGKRAQLGCAGEAEERRRGAEALIGRARQAVADRVAGAEDQRGKERLAGGTSRDWHEAAHRLDRAGPPQTERRRVEELQQHQRGRAVRAGYQPPAKSRCTHAKASRSGRSKRRNSTGKAQNAANSASTPTAIPAPVTAEGKPLSRTRTPNNR